MKRGTMYLVRGDVVFVLLLKINYDLIVIKSINLNSPLNRRAADARENAHARRAPRAILHGKPANKTGLNGPAEKGNQFK